MISIPRFLGLHHDHVDGSLAVCDVIANLYRLADKSFPFSSVEAWQTYFQNPQQDLVKKFGTVTGVLQSDEALEMLGYAYGKRRAAEGYKYVEAMFAPQYSTRGKDLLGAGHDNLTLAQATEAMLTGLRSAERDFRIRIMPCVCIGREAPSWLGVEVARVCADYDGEVSMGTVCDEASHPPEMHLRAFRAVVGTRVKTDCHTGEWISSEPAASYRERLLDNVRTAVYGLKVDRVSHDILQLLDAGIGYTINPDNDLFLPPMPAVVEATLDGCLTQGQWDQLAANVFRVALADDADKYLDDRDLREAVQ